ncbi:hypothetical protein CHI12_01060 [Terribacillus saccharophilus]|uniref:Uncharacterized protein n=1 Tax=Terribacillus saccharophilus TaxID=361277 RepID=A0A268HI81_9BACI|nr:hypothetical protein [Terribacillus saccharophilus]PAE09577.1 hypothetical protein CHI12_01060 [Terribacillus saccharophilus]
MTCPSLTFSVQNFVERTKRGSSINDNYFFVFNHKPIVAKIYIGKQMIELPDLHDIVLEKGKDGRNSLFFMPKSFIYENPKAKRTLDDMTRIILEGEELSMSMEQNDEAYTMTIKIR